MQKDGQGAFPSEDTLAKETGLTDKAVRKHLKIGAETGWIGRKLFRDKGKDWAGYRYWATLPKGIDVPEPRSAPNQSAPEPQVVGAESGAVGAEPDDHLHRNDVPTNSTSNSTYNSTKNSTENRLENVSKDKTSISRNQQEFHNLAEALMKRMQMPT